MRSRSSTINMILALLGVSAALAWIITQIAGVYSESVNWDEIALFNRAARSLASGNLETGGRPGLAVLLLMPFVRGCSHTMAAIHVVRLVWIAFTLGILTGVFFFSLRAIRHEQYRYQGAAVGTALLALVPIFLRWSIQIRTDQPAVCFALWGGVLVLASRERPRLALAGGALIGLGYLFSQKALYVAGLVGCVSLGDMFRDDSFVLRRDLLRLGQLAAGMLLTIAAYRLLVPLFFDGGSRFAVDSELATFANYRKLFGYRLYTSMLPTLHPHLAVLGATFLCLLRASRRSQTERRDLLLALVVAALGVVVGWFHAAAFPYFWSTLGLFPAIAGALAWPYIATASGRMAVPAVAALSAWLLWNAIPYRREVLEDSQAIQEESYAFIENELPRSARGFNPGGDLFCRADPAPFPTYFREAAEAMGNGPDTLAKQKAFIDEFRSRPVTYVVDTFLLDPFPAPVRRFWDEHYIRYAFAVRIPGRELKGPAGKQFPFDVLVPGRYTWHGTVPIEIAGKRVLPRETIELGATTHPVTLLEPTPPGLLTLAVARPPHVDRRPFHSFTAIAEILGMRQDW